MWTEKQQAAIDAINDLCESMLEYETRHGDAGDNYAFLVSESWTRSDTQALIEELLREKFESAEYVPGSGWINYKPQWEVLGIDPRWKDVEPDTLADYALESFDMAPGSIFGCFEEGIVLASFPVQEVEIELDYLGIDSDVLDVVRESCDAYISGCNRAYVATDSVWFALLDVESFNCQIHNHFIA